MSASEGAQDEATIQPFWCRALYDYTADEPPALSLQQGDIVEILTVRPSGWWDGYLNDDRGWFPSNYLQVISDEEAEAALAASNLDAILQPTNSTNPKQNHSEPVLDVSSAMLATAGLQSDSESWLNASFATAPNNRNAAPTAITASASTQIHDFWIPEVTDGGQIYYVNTQTGQRSRDLPGAESEHTGDLMSLAPQSRSRAGSNAGLGYASDSSQSSSSGIESAAGFGLRRGTGTPEPWVRRLADDGYAYYYFNNVTQEIQWTRPEGGSPYANEDSLVPPSRSKDNRWSLYSDSSEIQPDVFRQGPPRDRHTRHAPTSSAPSTIRLPEPSLRAEILQAEIIAQTLQENLAPPPQESITDLSAAFRDTIQALINRVHSEHPHLEEEGYTDNLVYRTVDSVRNLLYASAVPTSQIPTKVLPPDARDSKSSSSSSHRSPLKSAHRKVTANLSRLVLATRAIEYDSGSVISHTLERIGVDAEELESEVISFVLDVERMQQAFSPTEMPQPLKRLHGFFGREHIGLGLIGAGAAGSWTGFGFVPLDLEAEGPQRKLDPEVMTELAALLQQLDQQSRILGQSLQKAADITVQAVQTAGLNLLTDLSSCFALICNIHVAKHVDVSGVRPDMNHIGEDICSRYMEIVERAWLLVRMLEAAVQASFDESATLLLLLQSLQTVQPDPPTLQDRFAAYDEIDALSTSLMSNLVVVQQTLEALLSVGQEQAELAQSDYLGSIEMQLNRLSGIPRASTILTNDQDRGSDVDLAGALLGYRAHSEPKRNEVQDSEPMNSGPPLPLDEGDVSQGTDEDDELIEDLAPKVPGRRKKLEKFFGGAPTGHSGVAPPVDSLPWYLQPDHDPKEIMFDFDKSIKAGTVAALVERLTAHEHQDSNFLSFQRSFMRTFKSFTTVDELFDLLVSRFWVQPPPGLAPPEKEQWENLKQRVIRARVLNTFKSLISDEDALDKDDMHVLDRIKEFVQQEEVCKLVGAKTLLPLVERAQRGESAPMTKFMVGSPPLPIIPRAGKKLKLLDIDPLEMARQLTIFESMLYQKITPIECLQRARDPTSQNNNIARVMQTSNQIACWIAQSILAKDDPRRRATTVKQWITIADRCRMMKNFSTMVAITSGLNSPAIRRLKKTWDQLNQKVLSQFQVCEMTIDSSKTFHKYRQLMAAVTPPCVPFIGVFLSTLQFIHDGNADTIQPGNLVNFKKRTMSSEVISDIQRWQQTSFNLTPLPAVQQFIQDSLEQFQDSKDFSEHCWKLSLELEPREREVDRNARLLE